MKKYSFIFLVFTLLLASCKHDPVIPDREYLNQAAYDKITEFWNGYTTSSHGAFTITFGQDSAGQERLAWTAHIDYKHTLGDISLNQSPSMKLPEHFGSGSASTSLTRDVDQTIAFQIRSTTPQNEIMQGGVTIPKPTPITATDLGNNTFKITWIPQNRGQRVLIHLTYLRVYVQRLNNAYAVETDDDGELILTPSVFQQFRELPSQFPSAGTTEPAKVGLIRLVPKRKTTIKQPSTGKEYHIYGGSEDLVTINVLK